MTSDRLSIAMLSHLASPEAPTGAERSLALLAGALRERGHRVHVVAPGAWALEREFRERGVEVHVVPCRCCWLAYYEPQPTPVVVLKWARYALPDRGGRRLRALLRRLQPDVAVVNCLPHLRGAAVAHDLGVPVVWYVREILPPGGRRRFMASRLGRHAREIIAVSQAVGHWIGEEDLQERLTVIHNGVVMPSSPPDAARARVTLGLPRDGCLIGLFGQLFPHKGIAEFVRAARLALKDTPGLRFVLAGPGPEEYLRRMRREVAGDPAADRFHWLPPQPTAEVLLAAADAVCLPSLTPDPFPRAVLEAMAWGRPVAAFRTGGTGEMVVDGVTGFLAAPGDVGGLAAIFSRLGRDQGLRRDLGASAARRARDFFSLDRHVTRVEQVLRKAACR